MLDREFTFSDQRVIDELKKNFVTAAGNTHELQNGRSPARDWFMATAGSVNARIKNNITAQGFYVVAADGKAYGFNNNRDPERVLNFIQDGGKKFKANPPAKVSISAELVKAPF